MLLSTSDYLEEQIFRHTLRGLAFTSPVTVYAALLTSLSSDGLVTSEVTGSGYSRQAIAFDAPSSGSTSNSLLVQFDPALEDWGTVVFLGIYDAVSGGNLLFWGAFDAAKFISLSAVFKIKAGQTSLTMAGAYSAFLRDGIINLVLRNSAIPSPVAVYAGIGIGVSVDNSSITEPSPLAGYTRQGPVSFTSTGTGETTNTTALSFVADGGNWGSITHLGYFDDLVAGNLLYALALGTPRTINDQDGIDFDSMSVDLTVD